VAHSNPAATFGCAAKECSVTVGTRGERARYRHSGRALEHDLVGQRAVPSGKRRRVRGAWFGSAVQRCLRPRIRSLALHADLRLRSPRLTPHSPTGDPEAAGARLSARHEAPQRQARGVVFRRLSVRNSRRVSSSGSRFLNERPVRGAASSNGNGEDGRDLAESGMTALRQRRGKLPFARHGSGGSIPPRLAP
jgi:hypothetical protein